MTNIKLKLSAIIAKQIVLYIFDFHRAILPVFDKANFYRVPFKQYDKFREQDKEKFVKEFHRLKKMGIIKRYKDQKGDFVELTPKGKEIAKKYLVDQMEFRIPKVWDKKWRLVIFDIPEDKRSARDVLRDKLMRIGFIQLQKSVYVYPFDCLKEIELIKDMYCISPYVQYVLADRIETELNILENFIDSKLLNHKNSIKYRTAKDNFDYEIFNKEKLNSLIKSQPLSTTPKGYSKHKLIEDEAKMILNLTQHLTR